MLLIWVEGSQELVAEMVARGPTDTRGPTELSPGAPTLCPRRLLAMMPNAYFLAQSVSQDLETWRSWCVRESPPQITYLGTHLPGVGSAGRGSPGVQAPHQPTLRPAPHRSQAVPAQRPNPDS